MRFVLATANLGKAAELADLLAGFDVVPRPDGVPEPVEDGPTLLDNARIKARAIVAVTGEAAVADDTGLEVEALGGRPGVTTARYGGIDRLLAEMDGVGDRRARWRTVALVLYPDGSEVAAEGTCDGAITESRRGEGGFGYDPVFVPDAGDGRAFAEMTKAEKNAISHRGLAFRALAAKLT
ncbi:MAG: RdgB/HAM1 family non-canonical purine NTP pyrophosphatase [Acidimicrobiales bacterium]